MVKSIRLSIFIIMLFLIVSCKSTQEVALSGENRERAINAIKLLGDDMISNADINISIDSLSASIPESYMAYRDYVPLYYEYERGYLEGIADIAEDILPIYFDEIYDEAVALSVYPDRFISDDTSLTLAIRSNLRNKLIAECSSELINHRDSLDAAFSESRREFESIRKAYMNLDSVGILRNLPIAEEVDLTIVARAAIDSLFDALAEAEKELKNMIVDRSSDSLYSIFWEGR